MKSTSLSNIVIVEDTLGHALFLIWVVRYLFKRLIIHVFCFLITLDRVFMLLNLMLCQHVHTLFDILLSNYIFTSERGATATCTEKISSLLSERNSTGTLIDVTKRGHSSDLGWQQVFGRFVLTHDALDCCLLAKFLLVRHSSDD